MKKVMLIFGTRPEAIKMCPLVLEMRKHSELETVVCVTLMDAIGSLSDALSLLHRQIERRRKREKSHNQ